MDQSLRVRLVRTCSLPNSEGLYPYRILNGLLDPALYVNIRDGVLWDPARLGILHEPFQVVCLWQMDTTGIVLKLPAPRGKRH